MSSERATAATNRPDPRGQSKGWPVDRYTWQQQVCSDTGPPSSTARLILMVLSLHMKADGSDAWPSQKTIAKRARVSRRSVVNHLERAEELGWLARYKAGHGGQAWRLAGYAATVPQAVYEALPLKPWESDPEWRRGATAALPRQEEAARGGERDAPPETPREGSRTFDQVRRGASDDAKVVHLVQEVVHLATERGASGATVILDLNSPSELSLSAQCAAQERCDDARAKIAEDRTKEPEPSPNGTAPTRRGGSRRLATAGGFARPEEPEAERFAKAQAAARDFAITEPDRLARMFQLSPERALEAIA